MAKILIIYSTIDGHTQKICKRITELLLQENEVSLVAIEQAGPLDLPAFDKIIIGASIRYGKHNQLVYRFINEKQDLLQSRTNAFFSVNVVARKPEKNTPATNPYLKKFLHQINWQPQHLAVFAGRINYKRYKTFDRIMIRFIMWITKGPTDPDTDIEFTDWSKVDEFAAHMHQL